MCFDFLAHFWVWHQVHPGPECQRHALLLGGRFAGALLHWTPDCVHEGSAARDILLSILFGLVAVSLKCRLVHACRTHRRSIAQRQEYHYCGVSDECEKVP